MVKDNTEISEDSEEEIIEDTQSTKKRRIPDLDKDEDLKRAIVTFPESTYKKLGELALEKDVSRASIVRQALKEYFAKIEKPIKLNPKAIISDEDFNELLEACTTYYGGFKSVGEDGFFEKFKAEKWKLSNLIDKQFITLLPYLQTAYNGFMSKPSIDEFLGWTEKLEPTNEQVELLKLLLEHNVAIEEADKEKTLAELTLEINELIANPTTEETEETEE